MGGKWEGPPPPPADRLLTKKEEEVRAHTHIISKRRRVEGALGVPSFYRFSSKFNNFPSFLPCVYGFLFFLGKGLGAHVTIGGHQYSRRFYETVNSPAKRREEAFFLYRIMYSRHQRPGNDYTSSLCSMKQVAAPRCTFVQDPVYPDRIFFLSCPPTRFLLDCRARRGTCVRRSNLECKLQWRGDSLRRRSETGAERERE
jgi:hypothetical protein